MTAVRVNILGIGVDHVTFAAAVERIDAWLQAVGRHTAHVVTANPEMIMLAHRRPGLAEDLARADLVVADGMGVVWASKLLGRPLPERIAGIDLAAALLSRLAHGGGGVFLLGARPGVAERAARNLAAQYPGLRIVGTRHGYFSESESQAVIAEIRQSGADLLLVALGVPKQELWIARNRRDLNVKVAIGVGGAFDVFSGRTRRAPRFLQRLGLEWAYRLLQEPARVKRLGALPRYSLCVIREALVRGRHHE